MPTLKAKNPTTGEWIPIVGGTATVEGVWKKWTGTQAEFDAIVTKDPDTLYVVVAG